MKHALWIALCAACGTESSGSLLTSGMSAEMSAQAGSDGRTTVTAELFAGQPIQLIFVDLAPGDQLVARNGAETQQMQKEQLLTIVEYSATFDSAVVGDTFDVALVRSIDSGAPDSSMSIPPAFDLDPLPASASRASDLAISWSPTSTEPMSWQLTGDCVETASGDVQGGDVGIATIQAATLQPVMGQGSASCSVTLAVSRLDPGSLDRGFGDGGAATGMQVRSATFTSTP
jgi:hypothetical protein